MLRKDLTELTGGLKMSDDAKKNRLLNRVVSNVTLKWFELGPCKGLADKNCHSEILNKVRTTELKSFISTACEYAFMSFHISKSFSITEVIYLRRLILN